MSKTKTRLLVDKILKKKIFYLASLDNRVPTLSKHRVYSKRAHVMFAFNKTISIYIIDDSGNITDLYIGNALSVISFNKKEADICLEKFIKRYRKSLVRIMNSYKKQILELDNRYKRDN